MKKLLIAVLGILPMGLFAQTNAVTEDGRKVVLYDNGTWLEVDNTIVGVSAAVSTIEINEGLNGESKVGELFYDVSPKLERYFGAIKGKVKGNTKLIAVEGKVKVFFQFEFTVPDANRYYGMLKVGTKVNLRNKKDELLELTLTDDINFEVLEKYNFSYFTASAWLTPEQLQSIASTPVEEVEVFWKKDTEKYKVKNELLLMQAYKALNE